MNAPGISIRPYEAADETPVLAMLREALGEGRTFDRSVAFWRWKHFDNPFGASLLMIAADGEILGLRAFMRWRFRVGGESVSAVRAVDTATHPTRRRSGVFSRLTSLSVERARDDGVDLIFNTPNRVSLQGYLKLGWAYLGRLSLLVKILRPARVARAFLPGGAPQEGGVLPPRLPMPPAEALLSHPEGLDTLLVETDRLWAGGIRTERSVAFLRWRYCAAPSLRYYACWHGADPTTAVAIFRPGRRKGLREIVLSEVLLRRDALSEAVAMLRALTAAVDADYLVAHAPRGSVQEEVLRRAGFLPAPRVGPNFTVRALSPKAAQVGAGHWPHWRLSLGDLEVF